MQVDWNSENMKVRATYSDSDWKSDAKMDTGYGYKQRWNIYGGAKKEIM